MNNDLISREALMEDLFLKFGNQLPNGLLEEIDKAPTVETKTTYDVNRAYDRGFITAMNAYARPKGEWRVRHDDHFRCTNCEQYSSFNFNYCPNCGADMRGEVK